MNRRDFFKVTGAALGFATLDATVPAWLAQSAYALPKGLPNDRILVVVQMAGGNDGLNTVIPIADDRYNGGDLRPALRIRSGYHPLGDGLNAYHPRLADLLRWYQEGKVAVIQNVGYPNPNRSHFVSTDFWEYGASPGSAVMTGGQGWISRFFDNACAGIPAAQIPPLSMAALFTSTLPEALGGSDRYVPPRLGDFSDFKIKLRSDLRGEYLSALHRLSVDSAHLDFIQRVEAAAEATIDQVAVAGAIPSLRAYPEATLGYGLDNISKLIRSGQHTSIYFVTQGGYDTHNGQAGANDPAAGNHGDLLGTFNDAIHAFLSDMEEIGMLDRVMVMTFSEFGRRAKQNGSLGTDHGTGNCLFLLGGGVRGGVFGGQPDLDNLEEDNLRYRVDFRAVYGRIIEDWFGGNAAAVFGADWTNPSFDLASSLECIPVINNGDNGPLPPNCIQPPVGGCMAFGAG